MGKGVVRRLSAVVSSLALVAGGLGAFAVLPAAASSGTNTWQISADGTTSFPDGAAGDAGLQGPEFVESSDGGAAAVDPASVPSLPNRSQTHGNSSQGSDASESARDSANTSQLLSFDGLNHFAQRTANHGNQFSLEPPDQGLCAGNHYVLETINDVMAVYDDAGNKLKDPVDLNTFYGYAPAIVRGTAAHPAPVYGPFVTDPSCYFDRADQRWFHVVLTLETFPSNGRFTGQNHLDLAVSQTADPRGTWNLYRVQVQDDGNLGTHNHQCSTGPYPVTPTYPNACLGDYPHIGADANGFYITTNEYSFYGPEFKAAQVYAFSKRALASGAATVSVTQIDTTGLVGGSQAGFTVWPAESPNGQLIPPGDLNTSRGGTEFFMSSNAADEVNAAGTRTSTDLIVWALANTSSLNSAESAVSLTNTVLTVLRYAAPPASIQKAGSTPLRDCINNTIPGCWSLLFRSEPGHNEVEAALDSNDTRMQQVTFANGMLFGALDTALKVDGNTQAGIEWFAARPHVTADGVHAQVVNQGYVGAAGTNLTYPALGVNENGLGAIAFTLLGANDYPSAAYASFDVKSGVGAIHVAAAGQGPDDGFTGYVAEVGNPPRPRWGDYGAAVVDGSNLWIASEYIGQTCTLTQWLSAPFGTCGNTRTVLANWDTRITKLAIGG